MIYPGRKFNAESSKFLMVELFHRSQADLQFLSASEIEVLEGGRSPELSFPGEECLYFNLGDDLKATVDGTEYELAHYDVLYIPVGSTVAFEDAGGEEGHGYIYRALGEDRHPVFHAKWEEFRQNEARIRHLDGKEVFIMFDVGEPGNKFIAGYTFYESNVRAWPPHNHTDQEEVYSFIEGHGAMSVYENDEKQTYVVSVDTGDHITIPMLNYHPVFSQEDPLAFIWCIAGERYWVGDKNKDFMKGDGSAITT